MRKKLPTTILSHVIGWLFLLSLPLLFMVQQSGSQSVWAIVLSPYYWLFNLSFMALFYVHTYWLYPAAFIRKNYFMYGAALVLLCLGFLYLKPFDRLMDQGPRRQVRERRMEGPGPGPWDRETGFRGDRPPPRDRGREEHFDMVTFFLFSLLVALGMALQTLRRLRDTEKRALRAEADKANAELSFLKAQINPHFLFNTLNNIYSLAIPDSEPTADAIMKLSNIMRYVTEEVTADLVPLEREAACMQDYIDLHRLRLNKYTEVEYTLAGNLAQKSIPPMVLMTFVENAFKYGISNHEHAPITVSLETDGDSISFVCRNKLFEVSRNVVSTGVGLANVRQRLAHLYPGRHTLDLKQEGGFFTVTLTLMA